MEPREDAWHVLSEKSMADPVTEDRRMRESCPVAYSSDFGGFYALFRYDDLVAAARDTEAFTSKLTMTVPMGHPDAEPSLPLQSDPPAHRAYRGILVPLFRGTRLQSFESTLRRMTNDFIDQILEKSKRNGTSDLVIDYCIPLPAAALCLLMGLPIEDWERIHEWVTEEKAHMQRGDFEGRMLVQRKIYAYCDEAIERQRDTPGDTVMAALLEARVDGAPLSRDEMHGMFQFLIGAGHETVAQALANALHYLAEHPEEADRLRHEPELLDSAIEELLRWGASVRTLGRTTAKEVEIGGSVIPANSLIGMMWSSGAHDESRFPEADTCDFARDFGHSTNISFGVGIHRCLGEHLARLEMRVGISEFLNRVRSFEVEGECPPAGWPVIGFSALPVRVAEAG